MKLPLQNKIINGSFDYWQRGVTLTPSGTTYGVYLADRWKFEKTSTALFTISRVANVPSDSPNIYSFQGVVNTASGAIATGDFVTLSQFIEGSVLRSFKAKKMFMVFYIRSPKTGVHCVSFRNSANTKSLIKEVTVNAANTWERKIVRLEHDSTGTWNYDTALGMKVCFCFAAGATFNGAKDTWLTTNSICTTNQVNAADTIGNVFGIADVMLLEDNTEQTRDSEFLYAGRDIFEELLLCQRYLEKSYGLEVVPGTISNIDSTFLRATATTGVQTLGTVFFKTEKRVVPAITIYNPVTGTAGSVRDVNTSTNINSTVTLAGNKCFDVETTASINNQSGSRSHYVADAEL